MVDESPAQPDEFPAPHRRVGEKRAPYAYRWVRVQSLRLLRKVVRLRATPHAIALGTSIGVFIGMTPTVGLQMLIGVIIATLVGANRVAAALPAWITNPVTIVPIYSFNYWLGWLITGRGPGVSEFTGELETVRTLSTEGSFGAAASRLFDLGVDMLIPLWTGCVLVGLVCALPAYPLTRRAVVAFRARRDKKRLLRQQRVDRRMEETAKLRLAEATENGEGAVSDGDEVEDPTPNS